jgi:Fe2+ or Zn2+ uptake regulation protein
LDSIKDILKEHNLKASSARLLLLEKLRPEQAHFTAEELFNSLRPTLPGLSLATIYKNLEDLREAGILRMVTLPNQVRQYEWERGDHMHVVEGNQVRDLEDQALFDRIREMITEKMGPDFEVETIDVQIFGKKKTSATL